MLVWLGSGLILVLCWIGRGLDASVTELKNARVSTETRLTLVEQQASEMKQEASEIKQWLLRIEAKLDKVIK